MFRVNIYIGLNDKNNRFLEYDKDFAMSLVNRELAERFDGATTYACNGVYTHENGAVVVENSIRVLLYLEVPEDCIPFIQWAKKTFNQESILLEYTKVDYFEFV